MYWVTTKSSIVGRAWAGRIENQLCGQSGSGKTYSQAYEWGPDYVQYRTNPRVVKSLCDPSNNPKQP